MSDDKRVAAAIRPEVMREVIEFLSLLRDLRRQEANQKAVLWRRLGRLRGVTVAELARVHELLDREEFDGLDQLLGQGSEEDAHG